MSMSAIIYRNFQPEDAEMVQQTAREGWEYTYNTIFTEEFIANFINTNYHPEQLRRLAAIAETNTHFFDVALDDDVVIGFCHIGLTPRPQLYRIYLRPAYIGKGIGSAFIQRGEHFLKQQEIQ